MTSKIIEWTVFLSKMSVLEIATALCCHLDGTVTEAYVKVGERNIHTNNDLTEF